MSQLDELRAAERAEQEKTQNAPNDQKTRDLFPLVQSRCDGRKIGNGQVELKALLDDPFYRKAKVLLRVLKSSPSAPEWLWASHAHNDLISVWYENGRYHLEGKKANGKVLVQDCNTADEIAGAIDAYLAKIP
jgi:hypothetical protein